MLSNKKGFTLIELLIVIAIIGILASVAIPQFLKARVKAKCSKTEKNFTTVAGELANEYDTCERSFKSDGGCAQCTDADTNVCYRHSGLHTATTCGAEVPYLGLSNVPSDDQAPFDTTLPAFTLGTGTAIPPSCTTGAGGEIVIAPGPDAANDNTPGKCLGVICYDLSVTDLACGYSLPVAKAVTAKD